MFQRHVLPGREDDVPGYIRSRGPQSPWLAKVDPASHLEYPSTKNSIFFSKGKPQSHFEFLGWLKVAFVLCNGEQSTGAEQVNSSDADRLL